MRSPTTGAACYHLPRERLRRDPRSGPAASRYAAHRRRIPVLWPPAARFSDLSRRSRRRAPAGARHRASAPRPTAGAPGRTSTEPATTPRPRAGDAVRRRSRPLEPAPAPAETAPRGRRRHAGRRVGRAGRLGLPRSRVRRHRAGHAEGSRARGEAAEPLGRRLRRHLAHGRAAPGEQTVSMRFSEVRLDATTGVAHKHGVGGGCEGTLRATVDGLAYETSNKGDAFSLRYDQVEAFEVNYLEKNLREDRRPGPHHHRPAHVHDRVRSGGGVERLRRPRRALLERDRSRLAGHDRAGYRDGLRPGRDHRGRMLPRVRWLAPFPAIGPRRAGTGAVFAQAQLYPSNGMTVVVALPEGRRGAADADPGRTLVTRDAASASPRRPAAPLSVCWPSPWRLRGAGVDAGRDRRYRGSPVDQVMGNAARARTKRCRSCEADASAPVEFAPARGHAPGPDRAP